MPILLSHIGATITIIIWGVTFIASKILLETFTMIEILLIRFVLGFILLYIIDAFRKERKESKNKFSLRDEITFFLAGGTGVTLYYALETFALTKTSASNVGILVSLAPITTAIMALIWLKSEKFKLVYLYGFVIAFIGVVLVITNGTQFEGFSVAGDMLAIMGTLAWASYSLLLKRIDTKKYHIITYTKKIIMYGIITLIPIALYDNISLSLSEFTFLHISLFLFLGLGASALCFVFWNYAVDHLGVYKTSAYIYASPIVTLISAFLILQEPITIFAIIGSLCIITGLYISEHKSTPKLKLVKNSSLP